MNPEATYNFFKKLGNDNLSFLYQGEFSDDITEKILRLSEHNINNKKELSKLKNNVAFLMAECFQNIIHHGDKPEIINRTNNKPEMFLARNIGTTHYIASSNLIDNRKVDSVKFNLENLNTLDQIDLEALHLDLLTNEKFSAKRGAGFGLIEMARKSGQKLEFDFEFVNYFLSLFHLQLKLKSDVPAAEESKIKDISIIAVKEFHQIMCSENILMVHKGDFSQEAILPILGMIENNLQQYSETLGTRKKIFYLLIELLQNISKHAKANNETRTGIFILGVKDNGYILNTGNIIDNEDVEMLRNQLTHINSLDKNSLSELYKKNLTGLKTGYKGGAGLGLIDIARYSSEKLSFDFKSFDETSSFFSLSVYI